MCWYFALHVEMVTVCERRIIDVLILTSIPSLIGGCLVFLSFFLFPKLHNPTFYLVLSMTIAETLFPLGWCMFYFPPKDNTWQCNLQGWWIQFFPVAAIYFSFLIAVHIYLLIVMPRYRLTTPTLVKACLGVITLSLICSLVPLITKQYGNLGYSCWITLGDGDDDQEEKVGFAMRFGLEYAQVWAICLCNGILYFKILSYFKTIKERNRQSVLQGLHSGPDRVEQAILRLQYYPAILIFCWSGLIILRIYEFFSTNFPCWTLWLSIALVNSQGALNSIVFFSCATVWKSWYTYLGLKISSIESEVKVRQMIKASSSGSGSLGVTPSGGRNDDIGETSECIQSPISANSSLSIERVDDA